MDQQAANCLKVCRFIAADPGDTATLAVRVTENGSHLTDDRVRAIWRAQTMKNEEYQNGPLLLGTTHLAFLPGQPSAAHI